MQSESSNEITAINRLKLLEDLLDKGLSDHMIAMSFDAMERHGEPTDHRQMEIEAGKLLELIEPLKDISDIMKVIENFYIV